MADVRIALRVLRKNPLYALVAILTLAIGIGAATTIFSVLNAVVLRPLPYADSGRLVLIRDASPPRFPEFSVAPGRFVEWQRRNRSFTAMAAFEGVTANLTGVGDPVRMRGYLVSATTFPMLGIAPLRGRTFSADEDRPGSDGEVVLSEATWRARFAADPDILGRKILLDDTPVTVVGVMPASFAFPSVLAEFWRPIAFSPAEQTRYGSHYIGAIARLQPGVTVEAAGADLARAAREIESLPGNKGWTTLVFSYLGYTVRGVRSGLLVLAGAVGVVLLIACANVANLLLARGLGRQRELAVRAALGASRRRLVRQLLSENLVLGLAGSVAGVAIAFATLRIVTTSTSVTLPRLQTIGLDAPTLAFALILAALLPLVFGLLPALQVSRTQLRDVLALGGRGGSHGIRAHTRAALIIAEVALAVVLVASSALLLRSFARLTSVPTGFDVAHELVVPLSLPATRYADDAHRDQFWTSLLDRMSPVPGVEATALTQSVPFIGDFVTGFEVGGVTPTDESQLPSANFYAVTASYFKAMGIPLLRGRSIAPTDSSRSQPVAVVSKALADRYFGNADPLGKRIKVHQGPSLVDWEIVGVVGDVKQYGLDAATTLQVYEPARQHPYFSSLTLVVRSAADPEELTASVRGALRDLDPNVPITTARTLTSYVEASTGSQRFTTTLLGGFAGVAWLLAAIGVYGLVAFAVGQRTQEIGIRMALGASRSTVLGLVLRQGLGLTAIGVGLGALATLWTTRLLQAQLFEASARDALIATSLAPVALVAAATLACYVPARRALRVQPVTALRHM
jgi:putative ABC transport system permease protein